MKGREPFMNLDDVVPNPHFRIADSRLISAAPSVVWDELHQVTLAALPLTLALTTLRYLPTLLAGRKTKQLAELTFLQETPIPIVFFDRPRLVISAGLSQAWRPFGGSTPPALDPGALLAWTEPGWIKVGMEFRLEARPEGTRLSTETRVLATDRRTQRVFAIYWFVIRGGSYAIRHEVLKTVARRAEAAANGS
jgi:hypothetical protein